MAVRNRKVILRPGLPPIPPAGRAPRKKAKARPKRKRKVKPAKPKRKSKPAKKPTLAKRPKKTPRRKRRKAAAPKAPKPPAAPQRRDDRWRLRKMGLAALVVPQAAPREVVKVKRPCANKGNDRWAKPAGSRVYDAILRVMEPGKLYRMGDIRDATGLHSNHVKGYVQAVMPSLGFVEKVDARAVARRAAPLVKERLRGYRNLWRLTEMGVAEAQAVAEADRRRAGYLEEGEAA